MINQHLEQQSFPLFTNKIMHRLIDLNPIFDCIFSSFKKTSFRLVTILFLTLLTQVIELPNSNTLFFNPLLPNFQVLIPLFLLSLPLFFFLLHSKYLHIWSLTSASSGMAKGLSYLGTLLMLGNLGWLPFLESSSKSLPFIKLYNSLKPACNVLA